MLMTSLFMPPTDHGGRNGHVGQRQRLCCWVLVLNALNYHAITWFYLVLAITLSLASISVRHQKVASIHITPGK